VQAEDLLALPMISRLRLFQNADHNEDVMHDDDEQQTGFLFLLLFFRQAQVSFQNLFSLNTSQAVPEFYIFLTALNPL
jgi:hypothetical protein